ncbi:MAG: hypothetical protein NVS2B11_07030 [Acetobacteraceae bacterium]
MPHDDRRLDDIAYRVFGVDPEDHALQQLRGIFTAGDVRHALRLAFEATDERASPGIPTSCKSHIVR